jgi:hypothetical protein
MDMMEWNERKEVANELLTSADHLAGRLEEMQKEHEDRMYRGRERIAFLREKANRILNGTE